MTTICFRDGILASDSLVSWCSEAGGGTKYEAIKLYRVTGQLPGTNYGEYLVGIAGSVPAGQSFLEWLQKGGEPPESLVKDRAEADVLLVSKETGKAVVMDAAGAVMLENAPFYAIGSGRNPALAAMHAGKGAAEAVEIACRIDLYSGGTLQVMQFETQALPVA
ncbi:MAG TPA: hypothetical protein VIQ74_07040 [Gemmatimonadaceae bacterium]